MISSEHTHRCSVGTLRLSIFAVLVLLVSAGAYAQDSDLGDRFSLVGDAIAPKIAQAVTWGVVESVAGRVNTVGARAAELERLEAAGVRRFGLPRLAGRLISDSVGGAPILVSGNDEINRARGKLWGFGFAASSDYRGIGSGSVSSVDNGVEWNGQVLNGHLGFDIRLIREMMAGVSATVSQAKTSYEVDGHEGVFDNRMIGISPYMSWVLFPGLWWWATSTYGVGEATIDEDGNLENTPVHAGDSSLLSGAAGWNVTVVDGFELGLGSQLTLAIRGEGSLNEFKVKHKRGDMPDLSMNTWRGRVVLQGTYDYPVGYGYNLVPSLELGVRYDGGMAYSGAGIELGGSVRYDDISLGITVEARGRALVALDDSSHEWGIGGLVRVASDQDGHGLFLNVSPSYGDMGGDIAWNSAPTLTTDGLRLNAEWGYGGVKVAGVPGLLTPYGAFSLADGVSSRYRWGGRLAVTDDLNVSLEAQHEGNGGSGSATHSALFSANLRL